MKHHKKNEILTFKNIMKIDIQNYFYILANSVFKNKIKASYTLVHGKLILL